VIGIIFLLNVRYAPYIDKYIKVLEENGKEFEIIYWDRLDSPDASENLNTQVFKYSSNLNKSKLLKIKDFYAFRKFVINVINEKKYEKVIVLTTLTGILLSDILLKRYKGKYILDIRDYTFERNGIYKYILKKIVKYSHLTAISSRGFLNFLPKGDKYVITHNFQDGDIEKNKNISRKNIERSLINLDFLGSIRHFELDSKIVELFSKDTRFSLGYHGDGPHAEKFKNFINENSYDVRLTGRYDAKAKNDILNTVDIINGYYDGKDFVNKYAISNKFYDCIIYRIPILVNSDVYLGELVKKNNLGIVVNLNEDIDINEVIYEKYKNFDFNIFNKNCEDILKGIISDDDKFKEAIGKFIRE